MKVRHAIEGLEGHVFGGEMPERSHCELRGEMITRIRGLHIYGNRCLGPTIDYRVLSKKVQFDCAHGQM